MGQTGANRSAIHTCVSERNGTGHTLPAQADNLVQALCGHERTKCCRDLT
jgi:hypothetical protein